MRNSHRFRFAAAAGLGLVAAGATVALWPARPAAAADITVYKSASCGCCGAWIEHLEANGFEVDARDVVDVGAIKRRHGVGEHLASCHTAVVDGYVVEGHVPADVIQRMRKERPAIAGIAVPGMPMGSPGMEGPYQQPYQVLTFDDAGTVKVYAER